MTQYGTMFSVAPDKSQQNNPVTVNLCHEIKNSNVNYFKLKNLVIVYSLMQTILL